MSQPKLSFTIRRPTPSSATGTPHASRPSSTGPSSGSDDPPTQQNGRRLTAAPLSISRAQPAAPSPLAGHKRRFQPAAAADSSDEEGTEDEIITGFDELGVERPNAQRSKSGPLVIPSRPNRDWRQHSGVKRRAVEIYLPPGAGPAAIGKDGTQGGLGTRDVINSGPELVGLKFVEKKEEAEMEVEEEVVKMAETETVETKVEETLEQRALRALLHGDEPEGPIIDTIPLHQDEGTAYREDVATRPDNPTMDDYARVPIDQFGAALLRGMGWVEGTAASRTRKGMDKAYVPVARQALLGLGAKPRPEDTIVQSAKGGKGPRKPERRYVPLVKRVAEVKDANGSGASTPSGRSSEDEGRRRDRDRDDYGRDRGSRQGSDKDRKERPRLDRDRGWESDRPRDKDRDREREPERDRDKDAGSYRREDRRYEDRGNSRRDRDDDRDRERERDRRR